MIRLVMGRAEEAEGRSRMEELKGLSRLEKKVTMEWIFHGVLYRGDFLLKGVSDFCSVYVTSERINGSVPFVGFRTAIRSISVKGRSVFDNPNVPENYDETDSARISELRTVSFGRKQAENLERRG